MKKKDILYLVLSTALACSCASAPADPEVEASAMLSEARTLLEQKDYSAARDTILSLRKQHTQALQTRRAAILTLDSVELLEARDSVATYELRLNAARDSFQQMPPRLNGQTNDAYYTQQRRVMAMEQEFDELCAKVKFFLRKIDIDKQPSN